MLPCPEAPDPGCVPGVAERFGISWKRRCRQMARRPRPPTGAWLVRSIAVRKRDGPHRVEQVYRFLLAEHGPIGWGGRAPRVREGERDACGDLCSGVDRATGP